MKKILLLIISIALLATFNQCGTHKNESIEKSDLDSFYNYHSVVQYNDAQVYKLDWVGNVNFDTKIISGIAHWNFYNPNNKNFIVFDISDLNIDSVKLKLNGANINFEKMESSHKELGSGIKIPIEQKINEVFIFYKTSPNASALQWLTPQQTAQKTSPFLFSQSEAIMARSWVPCQDAPHIKFTYNATVSVPKNMLALMSAQNNPIVKNETGIYNFCQTNAIPSYLLALAVGDVAFKKINDRCGVYAEPNKLEQVANEFIDMGKMVLAAENLYGKYPWGRYDVIVLPPSFPFGGMENPCLTFATPTVIAGDKSLVSLVAHELAHSWSGNLVTNATWNDFWLNEGFTVYFENRIMEKLYGIDFVEMWSYLEYKDLEATLVDFGADSKDTYLKLDLQYRNPDDGMTDVAYIKGALFLKHIEFVIGRKPWDKFLKNYFAHHEFKSITTEMFLNDLRNELLSQYPNKITESDIQQWVYGPGLPENAPVVYPKYFKQVDTVLSHYLTANKLPSVDETASWKTHMWLHFINSMPANLPISKMQEIDKTFHFTGNNNSEIAFAWYILSIKTNYTQAFAAMQSFMLEVGRRKFIAPLNKELLKTPAGTELAHKIYALAKPNYHSVLINTLDQMFAEVK